MSDNYKMKLRSSAKAKTNHVIKQEEEEIVSVRQYEQQSNNINGNNSNNSSNNDGRSSSPKTPPNVETDADSNIESYFPPSPYGRKRDQARGDRFIPSRDRNLARDFQIMGSYPPSESKTTTTTTEAEQTPSHRESRRISAFFRAEVLDDPTAVDEFVSPDSVTRTPRRVLHYSSARTPIATSSSPVARFDSPSSSRFQTSPIGEAGRRILSSSSDRLSRHINTTSIKVLDAPELQDDFYLNLVDWGSENVLAVGLGRCVYLWNANTSRVQKLCEIVGDTITSVNWAQFGNILAVGANSGRTFLYDVTESKRIRTWTTHTLRVGSLAWSRNIMTSGGRDHAIYHHDVRSADPYFRKLVGHTQEVCGLKWNQDGTALASGGNDNLLMIWDSHENMIAHRLNQHTAAIKAIAWNPHKRGVLVSGGGTADKTIKFWNSITGSLTSSYDTGSQVCNICWSKKTDDLVSTHGYSHSAISSSNQVIVWKPDKMQRVATLTGHTSRVLYMSMSYDGSTVVTGAGDETLRFWDVFSSVDNSRSVPADRLSCIR